MVSFILRRLLASLMILLMILSFAACTTVPVGQEEQEPGLETPDTDVELTAKPEEEVEPEHKLPPRPKIKLTEDILFKILVAEVAGQA